MKTRIIISALALAVAAPAFAGGTQLERAANVQNSPFSYTTAQETAISSANRPAEANRLRRFFAEENGQLRRSDVANGGVESARHQLNASADVRPGKYSLSQTTAISNAKNDREAQRLRNYFDETNTNPTQNTTVSTSGSDRGVGRYGEWHRHPGADR